MNLAIEEVGDLMASTGVGAGAGQDAGGWQQLKAGKGSPLRVAGCWLSRLKGLGYGDAGGADPGEDQTDDKERAGESDRTHEFYLLGSTAGSHKNLYAAPISIPTGQWSEPITSHRINAWRSRGWRLADTRK